MAQQKQTLYSWEHIHLCEVNPRSITATCHFCVAFFLLSAFWTKFKIASFQKRIIFFYQQSHPPQAADFPSSSYTSTFRVWLPNIHAVSAKNNNPHYMGLNETRSVHVGCRVSVRLFQLKTSQSTFLHLLCLLKLPLRQLCRSLTTLDYLLILHWDTCPFKQARSQRLTMTLQT